MNLISRKGPRFSILTTQRWPTKKTLKRRPRSSQGNSGRPSSQRLTRMVPKRTDVFRISTAAAMPVILQDAEVRGLLRSTSSATGFVGCGNGPHLHGWKLYHVDYLYLDAAEPQGAETRLL